MNFIRKYEQLFFSILFTLFLVGARIAYTGKLTFAFIPWNLFLAIVPLFFSYKLQHAGSRVGWIFAAAWLLFFPNAMYIVTDLFHLHERSLVPYWFDLLILFSAAVNGLIAGFLSLYNTEQWLRNKWGSKYRNAFVFIAMLMYGYGIYLGRYERWNSWDIVTHPFKLLSGAVEDVLHPMQNVNVWTITVVFGIWMFLLYGFFRTGFHKKSIR